MSLLQTKERATCGQCGRYLGVGYYWTCATCGAAYCYVHIPLKCGHRRPSLNYPVS